MGCEVGRERRPTQGSRPGQEITNKTQPQDRIRSDLIQTIAVIELLKQKWCEPPRGGALHLSTLVQQTLSLRAQFGGIRADQAWQALCGSGPFEHVNPTMFGDFIRCLGEARLIQQGHDNLLVLDLAGEQLVNHFEFYSAFLSQEEYRIVHDGQTLGTLPVSYPVREGGFLIFAGRRWEVLDVDTQANVIEARPAKGGRVPIFGGEGPEVHDCVRSQMRLVLLGTGPLPHLDSVANEMLNEARKEFMSLGLDRRSVVPDGSDTLIFPWRGSLALHTLTLLLAEHDVKASVEGPCVVVDDLDASTTSTILREVIRTEDSGLDLARGVANKVCEKHHRFLSDELLCADYASSRIDLDAALESARVALGEL